MAYTVCAPRGGTNGARHHGDDEKAEHTRHQNRPESVVSAFCTETFLKSVGHPEKLHLGVHLSNTVELKSEPCESLRSRVRWPQRLTTFGGWKGCP